MSNKTNDQLCAIAAELAAGGPRPEHHPIATAPTAPGLILPPVLLYPGAVEGEWSVGHWHEDRWCWNYDGSRLAPTLWARLPTVWTAQQ